MIPIPPSHWLSWRQMRIDRSSASTSVTTVAPVVVKPDIPSKNASIGAVELAVVREEVGERRRTARRAAT